MSKLQHREPTPRVHPTEIVIHGVRYKLTPVPDEFKVYPVPNNYPKRRP